MKAFRKKIERSVNPKKITDALIFETENGIAIATEDERVLWFFRDDSMIYGRFNSMAQRKPKTVIDGLQKLLRRIT